MDSGFSRMNAGRLSHQRQLSRTWHQLGTSAITHSSCSAPHVKTLWLITSHGRAPSGFVTLNHRHDSGGLQLSWRSFVTHSYNVMYRVQYRPSYQSWERVLILATSMMGVRIFGRFLIFDGGFIFKRVLFFDGYWE